jgi:hypothetical protein
MNEAAFQRRIKEVMDMMRAPSGDVPTVPAMPVPDPVCNGTADAREAIQRFNIILDLAMRRR